MKIHNVEQGSTDWSILRAGKVTASEMGDILKLDGTARTGEQWKSYLAKKLAEFWLGGPLAEFNSFDMEQGSILENEALPWFSLEFNKKVSRPGFITTDDGLIGCSPDGMLEDGTGIEIKCPRPETHIKYLLAGKLPNDYVMQVHGSMFVTGAPSWTFISYRRKFPAFVLKVERDEEMQKNIGESLTMFLYEYEAQQNLLMKMNGGRPPRFKTVAKAMPEPDKKLTYLQ